MANFRFFLPSIILIQPENQSINQNLLWLLAKREIHFTSIAATGKEYKLSENTLNGIFEKSKIANLQHSAFLSRTY